MIMTSTPKEVTNLKINFAQINQLNKKFDQKVSKTLRETIERSNSNTKNGILYLLTRRSYY